MPLMIQTADPAPPAVVAPAPTPGFDKLFKPVAGLEPDEPLAIVVRSTAGRNWKPIVQQILASWAVAGVAPDCTDTAIDAESVVAVEAMATLPITLAADGETAERGEAVIRTVTPWCGADRRINILIFYQNGQSRGLNLSIGGTMTGLRLYNDILQQATPRLIPVMSARRLLCAAKYPGVSGRLTDTTVTSVTGDPLNPTAWSERWTWTVCGQDTTVAFDMTVQPDGSTQFQMTAPAP